MVEKCRELTYTPQPLAFRFSFLPNFLLSLALRSLDKLLCSFEKLLKVRENVNINKKKYEG